MYVRFPIRFQRSIRVICATIYVYFFPESIALALFSWWEMSYPVLHDAQERSLGFPDAGILGQLSLNTGYLSLPLPSLLSSKFHFQRMNIC